MPYTGHNDPKLPAHIKALSKALRQKFVKVYNAFYKNCRDPKIGAAGSIAKCAGAAMKVANSVVKTKEIAMTAADKPATPPPDDEPVEEGEKCSEMAPMYEKPVYFGGATSFDDVDKYREAQEFDHNISDQKWNFDQIFDNIMAQPTEDISLEQKLAQVKSAVDEFAARSEHPPESHKEEGLVGRAVGAVKGLLGGDPESVQERLGYMDFGDCGSLYITKDKATGAPRWVAIVTNKFWDRDKEVFSEASHEEFTDWVAETKEYSELRLWHTPGSRIGREDFTAYTDGFVVSSGIFDEGAEGVVASLAASKEQLKISHGYHYNVKDLKDGIYSRYRRFEISIVPASKAANLWTDIEFTGKALRKEVLNMPLTDEKRAFLAQHLGEERTAKIEAQVEAMGKELEDAGIGFKELTEILAGTKDESPVAEEPAEADKPADESADETPAATNEGGDDPGKDDPPAVTKELAPLAAFIGAAVAEAVKPLQEQIAAVTGQVKELAKSDEEKVADKLAPKTKAPSDAGTRPTDSEGNVIDDETAGAKGATDGGEKDEPPSVTKAREYVEMMTGAGRLPQG